MMDDRIVSLISCLGPHMSAEQNQQLSDIGKETESLRAQLAEERQQKHEALHREYCRREELERQIAEVTRERDQFEATCKLGLEYQAALKAEHREQLLATQAHAARLVEALRVVAEWRLPATGKKWPSGADISYEANFGSEGAKAFIRNVAQAALSTPINLDALHEDRAKAVEEAAHEAWLSSPSECEDRIKAAVLKLSSAHLAKKEGK